MAQGSAKRSYLSAPERRAEIVAAAARIGIEEGLERITLRSVAEKVGVRPGLINHYFPEAESLVAQAFSHTAEQEHELLFAHEPGDAPLARVAHLLRHNFSEQSLDVSRLWLNARNLSRYNVALRHTVTEQETLNRTLLTELIELGASAGDFRIERPAEESALLILILLDALSGYANEELSEISPLVVPLIYTAAERELGLPPGALVEHTS